LVDWDPEALTYTCSNRNAPLHYAALNNKDNSINGFQFVFDYGIKYYPRKNGIRFLFKKDRHNKTAFQFACEIHGRHEVMRVIEETLTKYQSMLRMLYYFWLMKKIFIWMICFLIRREPDVIQKLLSRSIPVSHKQKSR
jgi:hypothetical protein